MSLPNPTPRTVERQDKSPQSEEQALETPTQKLKLILKADSVGSLEAVKSNLPVKEVEIVVEGVGQINESDVLMAETTGCLIIGFQVSVVKEAERLATIEKIKIQTYQLIYNLLEDVDELVLKLKSTGACNYDIILASDYIVPDLIKDKQIKKIEKRRLSFLDQIDPKLLGHYYDPKNEYTIPYEWAIYGLGINKKLCAKNPVPTSWNAVFDVPLPYKVGMFDEVRFIMTLAARYLFGSIDNIDNKKFNQIKKLLKKQMPYVGVYAELIADYLVSSGNCPVVIALNSLIWKVMRLDDNVDFVFPEEGSFLVIDSVVIASNTKKEDQIYSFLNYLYTPELMQYHFEKLGIFPVNFNIIYNSVKKYPKLCSVIPSKKQFQTVDFFRNVLDQDHMDRTWIELTS